MINHKYKFIFVHIGKTGGSSIETALNPNVKLDNSNSIKGLGNTSITHKHMKAIGYQENYPSFFDPYFKFTFIRNPWDLEVSLWKWSELVSCKSIDFKEFLHRRVSRQRMGFKQWICDDNEHEIVDFIGKFENLQKDFDYICGKLGITPKNLPHTNKTVHQFYMTYYDRYTQNLVAEAYQKDIERFCYKFGD